LKERGKVDDMMSPSKTLADTVTMVGVAPSYPVIGWARADLGCSTWYAANKPSLWRRSPGLALLGIGVIVISDLVVEV
jgi:hypothetical protein